MQETERLGRFKIYFLILILFSSASIIAQTYPDARIDSLLKNGIDHIIKQEYNSAESVFKFMNQEYSYLPLGKIYLVATKIAKAYDYGQEFDEVFISDNLASAKEQSELLIEMDEKNIWYRYFLALAEGYDAYFDAINGNWISAFTTGMSSISEFENILLHDEKFYESYIGIGTFEYWKSKKLEFMNWLPFTSDTRAMGIEKLLVAIDSSSYNSHLAVSSLIWIYIDQKQFDDAIKIAEKALNIFPDSRTFKWGMARAYEEINPSYAIKLYKEILSSYPDELENNFINEITLKHIIAQQYAKAGNTISALKYCDDILSIKNIPPETYDEMKDRIERVKSLKVELTKQAKQP